MKLIPLVPGLLVLNFCILAAAAEPNSAVVEQEARNFAKELAALTPEQKPDAIIRWWGLHEAQFHPGPQAVSIRFFDEMTGCKQLAIPALKAAMASSNPEVRVGASAALGALAPLALPALGELTKGIEDADWRVREYSTLAVSDYGCLAAPTIPSMIKNLRHDSALLRGRTVFALGYLGDVAKPAVPALVEMLRHPETFQAGWTPALAVEALSRILWQHFANEKEVLDWWEQTGKHLQYSGFTEN